MHWAAHLGGAGGCLERCGRVKMTLFQQNPLCTHNLLPKPAGGHSAVYFKIFSGIFAPSLAPSRPVIGWHGCPVCAKCSFQHRLDRGAQSDVFGRQPPAPSVFCPIRCSFPTTATPLHQPIWPGLFAQDLVSSEDWRSPYVVSSTIASPALFSFQIHDLTTTPFQPRGASGLHFVALHFFLLLTAYFILRHLLIRRSAHDSDFPASLSLLTSALGT